GSALEIGAIGIFALQISWILKGASTKITPGAVWLLRAAVTFFFLQTLASAAYFHLTVTAGSHEELLWLISHFQPPLRDLQVHGFAMLMALGIGMALLPLWFKTRSLSDRTSRIVAAIMI